MSRLKIACILSPAVMGVLNTFTLFQPIVFGEELSEVRLTQLVETENQWII